jgi:mannose/fructose/N-acetylgalactosamine-specific phosphotransferase system component IIC
MVAWEHVGLAGVFGGLVALERRAFLQAMFSRPLVAAPFMGFLLDDVSSGVFVGLLLELFHLGSANLGAALADNETLAATGASAAAAALARGNGSTPAIWSLSVLLFIGLGRAGRGLDRALEGYSARVASKALAEADTGELRRAIRQNLWGMWPHFVVSGSITAACALVGSAAVPFWDHVPLGWVRGLAWAYPAMTSVAAAIAARGSHARRAPLFAGGAAALVCLAVTLYQLQRRLA